MTSNASALSHRRVDDIESELVRNVRVTLDAKRPGSFAQQTRESRDMRIVASRAIAVRCGRVRHPGGDLLF
jgi:hypothetical protein